MSIAAEQEKRLKLRRLLFEIDPQEANIQAVKEIERFNDRLVEITEIVLPEFQDELVARVKKMIVAADKSSLIEEVDRKIGKLSKNTDVWVKNFSDRHETVLNKFPEVKKLIDSQAKRYKDSLDQVVTEINGEIKRSYSRFGGATKPLAFFLNGAVLSTRYSDINFLGSGVTAADDDSNKRVNVTISGGGGTGGGTMLDETPIGTVNGINKVFTVTNLPIFISVSGQLMVNGSGYTISGTGPYIVTFDSAPTQTPHSFAEAPAVTDETPVGTVNGVNRVFTVTSLPLFVVVSGQTMVNGDGYTLLGGGSLVTETPSGIVNGVNTVFTVTNIPTFVVVSGQTMVNGDGYTLSGLTITFDSAPTQTPHSFYAGSSLFTLTFDSAPTQTPHSFSASGGVVVAETPTGIVDGLNTVFTVINTPLFISVSGQVMINGDGYTLSGLTVTFDSAPTQTPISFHA